jgi:hypothetical protein
LRERDEVFDPLDFHDPSVSVSVPATTEIARQETFGFYAGRVFMDAG